MSLSNLNHTWTYLLLSLYLFALIYAAPSINLKNSLQSKLEFEKALDNLLNDYFEKILEQSRSKKSNDDDDDVIERKPVNLYDQMQGDQPVNDENVVLNYNGSNRNMSDDVIKTRDRLRKENWREYLKSHILGHLRVNNTFAKAPEEPTLSDFNITQIIPQFFNSTSLDDDLITEKIRSFYPSCDPPPNQEQDQWKDSEDMMNLFFDFDYTDNKNSNIASATLRLYRLPQNSSAIVETSTDDCKPSESMLEEDRLLRVSVYWYTKFQKKRRVKRRLSDSKVIPETSRWIELSVKPATKLWNKAGTKNLGLGILVEDQEGKALRADKYFKGASCTVGVSTPKPIPTIVRDSSSVQADELDRIHNLSRSGGNSTSTVYSNLLLLPTIDICYLEFPENTDITHFDSARINACNLRKKHEENQRLAERERLERMATWHFASSSPRHIRHQRQHRQSKLNDLRVDELEEQPMSELERSLRSSITNKKILFTREELEGYHRTNRGLKR